MVGRARVPGDACRVARSETNEYRRAISGPIFTIHVIGLDWTLRTTFDPGGPCLALCLWRKEQLGLVDHFDLYVDNLAFQSGNGLLKPDSAATNCSTYCHRR